MIIPDEAAPEVVAGKVVLWSHGEGGGEAMSEIGWMVPPEFQGRGLGKRAVRMLLGLARDDGRWGLVHAFPATSNAPSNGICRSLGFRFAGERDATLAGRVLRSNHWVIDPAIPARRRWAQVTRTHARLRSELESWLHLRTALLQKLSVPGDLRCGQRELRRCPQGRSPVVADREDQLAMARVATKIGPPDQAPTAVHRATAHEMPLRAPDRKPAGWGAVTSRQLRPFQASRK
jgi:GNAT superfamily N-acetyltransferase